MKIIHQDGFSDTERAEYRGIIYRNVLDSAQQVLIYINKIGLEYVEHSNRVLVLFRNFSVVVSLIFSY